MTVTPPSGKPGFIESILSVWETTTGKVLVVSNLVPAVGLLFFNWSVYSVVFLYWAENIVIGVFQVFRMLMARNIGPMPGTRAFGTHTGLQSSAMAPPVVPVGATVLKFFLIPFFCLHYGGFCIGHGLFVMGLFGGGFRQGQPFAATIPPVQFAIVALIVAHAFFFIKEYLIDREGENASVPALMQEPYGRIVLLHVFIIGGAFFVTVFGLKPDVLLAIILLKTVWDCRSAAVRRWKAESVPA